MLMGSRDLYANIEIKNCWDSSQGTSHLANHLKTCTTKLYKDARQKINFVMKMAKGLIKVEAFNSDEHKSKIDLKKMIIKHNYSFSMVDHDFF